MRDLGGGCRGDAVRHLVALPRAVRQAFRAGDGLAVQAHLFGLLLGVFEQGLGVVVGAAGAAVLPRIEAEEHVMAVVAILGAHDSKLV